MGPRVRRSPSASKSRASRSHSGRRSRNLALAAALGLLVIAAAVRSFAIGTGTEDRRARLVRERQSFYAWTQTAIPLIVRYRHALRADARPAGDHHDSPVELHARVVRSERVLRRLQRVSGPIAASSPDSLRSFAPLLRRALALAVAAQRAYARGLLLRAAAAVSGRAAGRRRSMALMRRGNRRLRASQWAIAAFTAEANAIGAQLSVGRMPSAQRR